MKGTLMVEVHPWRGIGTARDLFFAELRLGFVTLAISRFLLTERLRRLNAELLRYIAMLRSKGEK